ncbi:UNKNOWN [Stylonychia lemnae]|uniref:Uncharacterized protein n=1 Tax=Stylonychia lemnae TaxID=5949 RepID=A0A078B906_STYLE|nr:UNKNOWN [Stylonychia lemnae]|eukprot:CDW89762.1 UNKNOWN [Stylonychia lemnae]
MNVLQSQIKAKNDQDSFMREEKERQKSQIKFKQELNQNMDSDIKNQIKMQQNSYKKMLDEQKFQESLNYSQNRSTMSINDRDDSDTRSRSQLRNLNGSMRDGSSYYGDYTYHQQNQSQYMNKIDIMNQNAQYKGNNIMDQSQIKYGQSMSSSLERPYHQRN